MPKMSPETTFALENSYDSFSSSSSFPEPIGVGTVQNRRDSIDSTLSYLFESSEDEEDEHPPGRPWPTASALIKYFNQRGKPRKGSSTSKTSTGSGSTPNKSSPLPIPLHHPSTRIDINPQPVVSEMSLTWFDKVGISPPGNGRELWKSVESIDSGRETTSSRFGVHHECSLEQSSSVSSLPYSVSSSAEGTQGSMSMHTPEGNPKRSSSKSKSVLPSFLCRKPKKGQGQEEIDDSATQGVPQGRKVKKGISLTQKSLKNSFRAAKKGLFPSASFNSSSDHHHAKRNVDPMKSPSFGSTEVMSTLETQEPRPRGGSESDYQSACSSITSNIWTLPELPLSKGDSMDKINNLGTSPTYCPNKSPNNSHSPKPPPKKLSFVKSLANKLKPGKTIVATSESLENYKKGPGSPILTWARLNSSSEVIMSEGEKDIRSSKEEISLESSEHKQKRVRGIVKPDRLKMIKSEEVPVSMSSSQSSSTTPSDDEREREEKDEKGQSQHQRSHQAKNHHKTGNGHHGHGGRIVAPGNSQPEVDQSPDSPQASLTPNGSLRKRKDSKAPAPAGSYQRSGLGNPQESTSVGENIEVGEEGGANLMGNGTQGQGEDEKGEVINYDFERRRQSSESYTESFKHMEPFKFDLEPIQEVSQIKGKRERLYKVLVVGELGTGKTSIIKRYVHQFFSKDYRATIGVDFALRVLRWDPETVVRLQLWDIAGQERFGSMTRVYYKEAVGALVVCDVTRESTLEAVIKWKQDVNDKVVLPDGRHIPVVLLANKVDKPKEGMFADKDKMNTFCKEQGFTGWFETSAKENVNIDDAANFLVAKILEMDRWSHDPISPDPDKLLLSGFGSSGNGFFSNCSC